MPWKRKIQNKQALRALRAQRYYKRKKQHAKNQTADSNIKKSISELNAVSNSAENEIADFNNINESESKHQVNSLDTNNEFKSVNKSMSELDQNYNSTNELQSINKLQSNVTKCNGGNIQYHNNSSNNIPDILNDQERKKAFHNAINYLNRTHIDEKCHHACVCVVCDCFIIGTDVIKWLSKEVLKKKESYLSVRYLESVSQKKVPEDLQEQYRIEKKEMLSNLLLSPRSCEKEGMFMSCKACY